MVKKYTLVWDSENKKWHLFGSEKSYHLLDKLFPDGYVDYYITVEDDIIKSDTFCQSFVGSKFSDRYAFKNFGGEE